MVENAVFTLLHILIFVYWLGGDLGAFYSASILTDSSRPAQQRIGAAVIIKNVDMAPRMALIFALPTGLALADARGWLEIGWLGVAFGFLLAATWAGLAWKIHLKPSGPVKMFDLMIRWGAVGGLIAFAIWGYVLAGNIPGFLALKCVLLALAIVAGLMIRRVLKPFESAFPALLEGQPDEAADTAIRSALGHTRRIVVLLWGLLLAAAFIGAYV